MYNMYSIQSNVKWCAQILKNKMILNFYVYAIKNVLGDVCTSSVYVPSCERINDIILKWKIETTIIMLEINISISIFDVRTYIGWCH